MSQDLTALPTPFPRAAPRGTDPLGGTSFILAESTSSTQDVDRYSCLCVRCSRGRFRFRKCLNALRLPRFSQDKAQVVEKLFQLAPQLLTDDEPVGRNV